MANNDPGTSQDPVLTAEDIEAAYERALSAMDAVEIAVDHLQESVDAESGDVDDNPHADVPAAGSAQASEHVLQESVEPDATEPVLHPREIIEAALFVGGQTLTTKRLCHMLGAHETPEQVDAHIAQLNQIYRDESRPYQIDFGEGGYRLVLLPEFDPVRNDVFGAGPKDVKLSQDALETLAFVAYRQPTTKDDLEAAGKEKATSLLRQLLRRELILLDRDDDGQVTYSTSARFLDVFGLRSLDELPFPDDLELK